MGDWILAGSGFIIAGIMIAYIFGRARDTAKVDRMVGMLIDRCADPDADAVNFDSFSELPPPVARYFRHVLADGQKLIKITRMRQSGMLRNSMKTDTWSSFAAHQVVAPHATGFVWNAKVAMPLGIHVRVLDSYSGGVGSGRVGILSALAISSEAGAPEINSGHCTDTSRRRSGIPPPFCLSQE